MRELELFHKKPSHRGLFSATFPGKVLLNSINIKAAATVYIMGAGV